MATTTGPEAAGSEQANSDEQTAEAERVGGVLEPTDRREIISWFAYDCGSSPVAYTIVTFWALLITEYGRYEAAGNPAGIEWREHNKDGNICTGTCSGVPCGQHPWSSTAKKQLKPEGMSSDCTWFPSDNTLPHTGIDYSATVIYCNLVTQLGCGLFLVCFGSLGDFGYMRYRGLVLGWLFFSLPPIAVVFVNDTSLYWISALGYAVTIVAIVTAQQMFDSYLPLLAKAHMRTRAAGAHTQWTPAVAVTSAPSGQLTASLAASTVVVAAGLVPEGVFENGLVSKGVLEDGLVPEGVLEDGLSVAERVDRTRQSVAGELAFGAASIGFAALLVVTLFQLAMVSVVDDRLLALRLCVLVAGVWAFVFSAAGLSGLRTRPGIAFETTTSLQAKASMLSRLGFHRLWLSTRILYKHHPEMGKLLIGHLLSSITIATVISSFTVFVQRELNATATDIIMILIIAGFISLVSTASMTPAVKRFSPRTLRLVFVTFQCITTAWPLWAALGMHQKWEMFALVSVGGLINPCIFPMTRTIFQQILPHGYEAALFSLLGVCSVGFSWIGSLTMAALLSATGSMRLGFLAIMSFVLLSLVFYVWFDFDKAQEDRRKIEAGGELEDSEFEELRTGTSKL